MLLNILSAPYRAPYLFMVTVINKLWSSMATSSNRFTKCLDVLQMFSSESTVLIIHHHHHNQYICIEFLLTCPRTSKKKIITCPE